MKSRRKLTLSEKKLANFIFKHSLNYDNIEVREARYKKHLAITPFGSMYFPVSDYKTEYVGSNMYKPLNTSDAHWFVHELVHVWQHYVGMSVILLAAKSRNDIRKLAKKLGKPVNEVVYSYTLTTGTDLLDYNIEQQGDIIADYFSVKMWGLWSSTSTSLFEGVLSNFLKDPSYPTKEKFIRVMRSKVRGVNRD